MTFPSTPASTIHDAHKGSITVLCPNAAATYLLSAGVDRAIHLYNVSTHARVQTYLLHASEVLALSINGESNGAQFASSGADRNIFVWDTERGVTTQRLRGHDAKVTCVEYGPQGVLFTGSFDGRVNVWDTRSRGYKPIQVLADARDGVTGLAVANPVVHVGSLDGALRSYDLRKGVITTDRVGAGVAGVTTVEAGTVLVSTLASELRLVDDAAGVIQRFAGHVNTEYLMRPSVVDMTVLAGSEDGRVYGWDLDGTPVGSVAGGVCVAGLDGTAYQFATGMSSGDIALY